MAFVECQSHYKININLPLDLELTIRINIVFAREKSRVEMKERKF
jgi:hypothetical protein